MCERSEINCEASLKTREEMLMEGGRREVIGETAAGVGSSGATGSAVGEK